MCNKKNKKVLRKQLPNKISPFFNTDGTNFGGIWETFLRVNRESLRGQQLRFCCDLGIFCFAFTLALEHSTT